MNAELREAVDSAIGRVKLALLAMPFSSAERSDLDAIARALRDQEAEMAELRREMDDYNAVESALEDAIAAQNKQRDRAEKADALLRECHAILSPSRKLHARITAHLGGEQ